LTLSACNFCSDNQVHFVTLEKTPLNSEQLWKKWPVYQNVESSNFSLLRFWLVLGLASDNCNLTALYFTQFNTNWYQFDWLCWRCGSFQVELIILMDPSISDTEM